MRPVIVRVGIAALAAMCVGALARAASADERPRFSLVYERVAGCPDEGELRAAVVDQLGADPFDDAAIRRIAVSVVAARGGVRGRVEMRGADGQPLGARVLEAASCAELAPVLELAIAVAIDPLRAGAVHPPRPANATPPAPTPAPVEVAPVAPLAPPTPVATVARRRRATLRPLAAAGVMLALDAGPSPTVAFVGQIGLAAPRWSASVELRGDAPSSSAAAGGRVSTALVAVVAAGCVNHRLAAFCALAAIGGEEDSGAGYLATRSAWSLWAALGGRVALQLGLSRQLALVINLDVLAPLTRTELWVGTPGARDATLVHVTSPIQSVLGVRLAANFP